jgi:hypothetical protein
VDYLRYKISLQKRKNILSNCGMSNIWLNKNSCSSVSLSSSVEQKLKDQFFQEWFDHTFWCGLFKI